MKIIDSTTYFEEDMMIDLRLNILNDYVDMLIDENCNDNKWNEETLKNELLLTLSLDYNSIDNEHDEREN